MQSWLKPVAGLAVIAAVAGIVVILIALDPAPSDEETTGQQAAPQSETPQEDPVKDPAEEYVSPTVPESEWALTNSTVEDVVQGILLARERNDLAWLARTMESTAAKESLVEDDLLAAHRQYTWGSTDPLWAKVAASWQARTYSVEAEGDRAELVMQVGSNLGELRLPFVRIDGAWYFAGI